MERLEERNYTYEELCTLADAGHAEAQNEVGICLMTGRGVEENAAQAIDWFIKSAEQGCPQAMTCLGRAYSEGIGVSQDEQVARDWLLKAAEMGYGGALFSLGLLAHNSNEALNWYEKAIEAGEVEAMHTAAELYLGKFSGPKRPERAIQLYRMAAERGHPCSQYILGRCLAAGEHVAINETEAAYWLSKSAEGGFPIMKEDAEFIEEQLTDV